MTQRVWITQVIVVGEASKLILQSHTQAPRCPAGNSEGSFESEVVGVLCQGGQASLCWQSVVTDKQAVTWVSTQKSLSYWLGTSRFLIPSLIT